MWTRFCSAEGTEFRIASLEAQRREIVAQMDRMIAVEQKKLTYYDRWNGDLKRYAEQHRGNTKSIKAPYGSLLFRKVPSRLIVREGMEDTALEVAREFVPDAVKTVESLLISVMAKHPAHPAVCWPGCFEMTEETESFKIDCGVK